MGAAMTNREWWEKRFKMLVDLAKPIQGIQEKTVYDKNGVWPAIKLVAMRYLLGPYATIMAAQREAGNWDSLHLVDVCSGSGLTKLNSKRHNKCETVAGSAIIGAREERFDHYHFIEPLPEPASALRERLLTLLPEERFTIYEGSRAGGVAAAASNIAQFSKNPHYLSFVDLEGFELTLAELNPLFTLGRGDFMFNLQHQMAKRAPAKATAFLGTDTWNQEGSDDEVVTFFLRRLKELGRPATAVVDITAGKGSGRYGYKVVYAAAQTLSRNPWLANLDSEIQRRWEGIDGAVLDDLLFGGQQTLF